MATVKFTVQRGKTDKKDITVAGGTAEVQSDTVSINIDYTNAARGDIVLMIDKIQQTILNGPWPPL